MLLQIFEVYEGKIAVFPVPDEQIDLQTELVEPIDVEILAITGEIGHHEEFAAARTVADGLHVRKRPQEVLAVLFADLFGFTAHAAENFDSWNHVVAVEPVGKRILAAAEQNGTVALFREDAVEIVYPECNAAPSQKRKRDKEAGADHQGNPTRIVGPIS